MKLAAVGDNCMDVYAATGQAFPGGNPVNVAVYTVRMGGSASYTGAVGDDAYGSLMRDALERKNVDVSHLHTLPGETAATQVELRNGERILGDYTEGVLADFALSPEDMAFLCTHDIVHTGWWGKVEGSLAEIRARGVPVSFDFADKEAGEIMDIALPATDYAFFAREADTPVLREYLRAVHAMGPRLVVATLGGEGSLAYDGQAFTRFGIVPVEVVDSMGAGDSYIAGFLRGILERKPIDECMRMGAENASQTLRYMGAW